jgi:integrase
MSVRKRQWHTNVQVRALAKQLDIEIKGARQELARALREDDTKLLDQYPPQEAWIVDYFDQNRQRTIKTFDRKKDADSFLTTVKHEVREGIHTPISKSITVAKAAEDWLGYISGEGRERSTYESYSQHARLHIVPRIGNERLAKLTTPRIQAFRDELIKSMSRPMAKKVLTSLKAILKDAKRRGNVAQNVAADVSITSHGRIKTKPQVGRDIPTRDEIRRIIGAAQPGKGRAFLLTAALTGMRASELRGLRWSDVDLNKRQIHVRQRADHWRTIGQPKSAAGARTIPIEDMVANTLREWKLQCPKGTENLVFPTGVGTVDYLANFMHRYVDPAMIAAGVVDSKGRAKYGMHAFRHFYASWCINRKADGGLELPPKTVQARLGHSSIVMTLDRYGHLFPAHDDGGELAAAARALFAT